MNNSELYNIVSENELTEVIAHFNTEFILTIVDAGINMRWNPSAYTNNPNVIDAWDLNFKQIIEYYNNPDMTERLTTLRADTYKEIIDRVCKYHEMNFTVEEINLYTAAHYIYQFFVSQFLFYMDSFFANYIIRETDAIFDAMDLNNMKKNKDASTIYNRRVYKDEKIAIIVSNIDRVIRYISNIDFSFDYILYNCGLTKQEADYMLSIVSPQSDFFKQHYVAVLNNEFVRPNHLTNIRFMIRNLADPGDETYASLVCTTTDQIDPVV